MEAHPVPQNVTSFEFHLVGDMTLKQFGYLASGMITAYLTFIFVFPISKIIAIPIIGISASLGAAFAFLPIADRPLDHWTVAFFRAIYAPTKRQWKNPLLQDLKVEDPAFKNRLKIYLNTINPPLPEKPIVTVNTQVEQKPEETPTNSLPSEKVEEVKLKGLSRLLSTVSQDSQPVFKTSPIPTIPQNKPLPTPQPQQLRPINTSVLTNTSSHTSPTPVIAPTPRPEVVKPAVIAIPQAPIQPIAQAFTTSGPIDNTPKFDANPVFVPSLPNSGFTTPTPTPPVAPVATPSTPVINVPQPVMQKPAAAPQAPQFQATSVSNNPNIISGVVVNSQNQPIEGAIVIINNQSNIPVRAMKTLKAGSFTGATPLPNGKYLIEIEKDGHDFAPVQVELVGNPIPTLIIRSRAAIS